MEFLLASAIGILVAIGDSILIRVSDERIRTQLVLL